MMENKLKVINEIENKVGLLIINILNIPGKRYSLRINFIYSK